MVKASDEVAQQAHASVGFKWVLCGEESWWGVLASQKVDMIHMMLPHNPLQSPSCPFKYPFIFVVDPQNDKDLLDAVCNQSKSNTLPSRPVAMGKQEPAR